MMTEEESIELAEELAFAKIEDEFVREYETLKVKYKDDPAGWAALLAGAHPASLREYEHARAEIHPTAPPSSIAEAIVDFQAHIARLIGRNAQPMALIFDHATFAGLIAELGAKVLNDGKSIIIQGPICDVRALPMTSEELQALAHAQVDLKWIQQFLAEERKLRETPGSGGA